MKKIGRTCNKLYRRLCITRSASKKDIKQAYREMAQEVHPDVGGSGKEFIKLQEAYQVLSDRHRKRHYDQTGEWLSTGLPEQTRVRQRGNDVLAQQFSIMIEKQKGNIVNIDVISTIKMHCRNCLQKIDEDLEEIRITLDAVDIILELIEHDGKGMNVFEGVLFGIARENEITKIRHLEDKEGFTAALEIIEHYRFNFRAKQQKMPHRTFTFTTNTSSTSG